ncbi:hypothetical protein D3C78_1169810 [compost metagenome]
MPSRIHCFPLYGSCVLDCEECADAETLRGARSSSMRCRFPKWPLPQRMRESNEKPATIRNANLHAPVAMSGLAIRGITSAPIPNRTSSRLIAIAVPSVTAPIMMVPMTASIIPKPKPAATAMTYIHSQGGRKAYAISAVRRRAVAIIMPPRFPKRRLSRGETSTPARKPAN